MAIGPTLRVFEYTFPRALGPRASSCWRAGICADGVMGQRRNERSRPSTERRRAYKHVNQSRSGTPILDESLNIALGQSVRPNSGSAPLRCRFTTNDRESRNRAGHGVNAHVIPSAQGRRQTSGNTESSAGLSPGRMWARGMPGMLMHSGRGSHVTPSPNHRVLKAMRGWVGCKFAPPP